MPDTWYLILDTWYLLCHTGYMINSKVSHCSNLTWDQQKWKNACFSANKYRFFHRSTYRTRVFQDLWNSWCKIYELTVHFWCFRNRISGFLQLACQAHGPDCFKEISLLTHLLQNGQALVKHWYTCRELGEDSSNTGQTLVRNWYTHRKIVKPWSNTGQTLVHMLGTGQTLVTHWYTCWKMVKPWSNTGQSLVHMSGTGRRFIKHWSNIS